MSTRRRYEIPELFPQPKQIILTEGESDLSTDIRLVTSNVLPLQRKAIRSILTAAGVKVVANKKKYVVDATVKTADDFDLNDVPENARQEYYEIEIKGSEIFIRTPFQEGTVWAAQTLASLFRRFQRDNKVPNLVVKDWPSLPVRGVFVENKWGPDRMNVTDWYQAIDALSAVKLNTMGVGLYGCWGSCRFEGTDKPTEFLMVPVQNHEELAAKHYLRWFSPAHDEWKEATYLPFVCEHDFFADIVNYGRERGVNVVPYVNSLGHNTFFPRMLPELSAKDEDGAPKGTGYCLSNPDVKTFIQDFYGGIIDKYYPNGIDTFHIQLDEIGDTFPSPEEPTKRHSQWCQCEKCAQKSREELLQQHILWLAKMLVEKGVDKVVLWNDMLTRSMKALTPDFAKQIKDAGLDNHLIIDFWGYNNQTITPEYQPKNATKLNLKTWVTPMTCYYNWSTYNFQLPNIGLMMDIAFKQNAEGAVSYAVHAPSHLDHEAALAGFAWENCGDKVDAYAKRWSVAHFDSDAKAFRNATELLREVIQNPAYPACLYYQYSYSHANWPRPFPQEPLDKLMQKPQENLEALQAACQKATEAEAIFVRLCEREGLDEQERDCIKNLRAEALRMMFVTKAFAWLLDFRHDLETGSGTVKKSKAEACAALHQELLAILALAEKNFPIYLAPAALAALAPLFAFMSYLTEKLKELGGRKKASSIDWAYASCKPVPKPVPPKEGQN